MNSFDEHLHQWTQKYRFNIYWGNIDMNARDSLGWTPFTYTCPNGHKDVVEITKNGFLKRFDNIFVAFWTSVHKRSPSKTLFSIHINVATSINVKTPFLCPLMQAFIKWVHPKVPLPFISIRHVRKIANFSYCVLAMAFFIFRILTSVAWCHCWSSIESLANSVRSWTRSRSASSSRPTWYKKSP